MKMLRLTSCPGVDSGKDLVARGDAHSAAKLIEIN